jgi:hypothetical protein
MRILWFVGGVVMLALTRRMNRPLALTRLMNRPLALTRLMNRPLALTRLMNRALALTRRMNGLVVLVAVEEQRAWRLSGSRSGNFPTHWRSNGTRCVPPSRRCPTRSIPVATRDWSRPNVPMSKWVWCGIRDACMP